MAFSSSLFLFAVLPLVILTTFLPSRWMKASRLVLSLLFYLWGDPRWFAVLMITTVLDWHLARRMEGATPALRRTYLITSLFYNVGALLFTKYTNFFIETSHLVMGTPFHPLDIIMPLGISFITFQKVSYMVDVHSGRAKPGTILNLFTYTFFFPNIISGPIARWSEMQPGIQGEAGISDTLRLEGMFRFILGLAKKVLIGNVLGREADAIFGLPAGDLSFFQAWYGALAYTFQLYFDFAGYSDMAIGIGLLLGLRLPENFRSPYASGSVTEFWRRWHMTLGAWMRQYIYIPLGGNRVSSARIYINLWIVFFLSGLWHGASYTFVLWGAWHGLALVLERFAGRSYEAVPRPARTGLTFLFVVTGWVLFRSTDLSPALTFLGRMFGATGFSGTLQGIQTIPAFAFALAALLSLLAYFPRLLELSERLHVPGPGRLVHVQFIAFLVLFLYSIGEIAGGDAAPFIYFRF